jgi:phospholipid/cholesterol/gamma-HCH transport system permease protein
MAAAIVRTLASPRKYLHASLTQAYGMGIRSLPLVLFMALIGGAIASQQTGAQFAGGLPVWVIGSVVAAGVLTELGPVLTAIVLIGRLGASIAAELATMKVTEQIDALYAIGRDPVTLLIVPRVVGGALVVPPLVIMADAMGIFSGWAVGMITVDGLTTADFLFGARFYFRPWVLFFSLIKAAVFGVTITFLACFIGLEGRGGRGGRGPDHDVGGGDHHRGGHDPGPAPDPAPEGGVMIEFSGVWKIVQRRDPCSRRGPGGAGG